MPADLLFEIGCEEIPARMLADMIRLLRPYVDRVLDIERLSHAGVRTLGTPRRLAVIVSGLAERATDLNEEVVGPPVSAAFAPDGTLTKAGQGFAAKNGVAPESLVKREVAGKRGQYVVALRNSAGRETRELLPEFLAQLASGLQWPKSQRWGWSETKFVRPVQWLLALYGGEVVPLAWAGLTAGRTTRGHRFLSPGALEIASATEYEHALEAAHVIVDPEKRRSRVRAELARLESDTGCRLRPDEALLGEVIHLGEWPVGIAGEFDPSFLEVPEEIIVTSMRTHLRYFAFEDAQGKLANRFATLMATEVTDRALVQRGNERVLAARLADAKFFFAEDRKHTFAEWNAKLEKVVFQAKLGEQAKTTGAKIRRIEAIVATLGGGDDAKTAATYAKSDLASHVVGEFPELQGVMGKHYALLAGYSTEVALAIEEHYLPKGQGGALPTTREGALVALADRIDTLVGCFAVGLVPSGSADPFGLRRAAIGILAILLDGPVELTVTQLVDAAVHAYGDTLPAGAAREPLHEFFKTRLRSILVEEGTSTQEADAALAQGFDVPSDARTRARALPAVPPAAREVFKRIGNILDDARAKHIDFAGDVEPTLFAGAGGVEAKLHGAFAARRDELDRAQSRREYPAMLAVLVAIQPEVTAFFDKGGVMVMDPKADLRRNRLALLESIYSRFVVIADFRQLGGAS
ncbi:MAG TPA: glycine--tRNA ligase subunit beta [Kofleriaceae bacterium]|jgi:glycyl-tRNA synthetase beta chain